MTTCPLNLIKFVANCPWVVSRSAVALRCKPLNKMGIHRQLWSRIECWSGLPRCRHRWDTICRHCVLQGTWRAILILLQLSKLSWYAAARSVISKTAFQLAAVRICGLTSAWSTITSTPKRERTRWPQTSGIPGQKTTTEHRITMSHRVQSNPSWFCEEKLAAHDRPKQIESCRFLNIYAWYMDALNVSLFYGNKKQVDPYSDYSLGKTKEQVGIPGRLCWDLVLIESLQANNILTWSAQTAEIRETRHNTCCLRFTVCFLPACCEYFFFHGPISKAALIWDL